MPLLVCSFLQIKETKTKVKIKYTGLQRAQPFLSLLPALQKEKMPAERLMGTEKTAKKQVSKVKSPTVHLLLPDWGPWSP